MLTEIKQEQLHTALRKSVLEDTIMYTVYNSTGADLFSIALLTNACRIINGDDITYHPYNGNINEYKKLHKALST